MKVVLFVNSLKTFYWHRQALAEKLQQEGFEVVIITSKDESIRTDGPLFNFEFIELSRKGLNPAKELLSIFELIRILMKHNPRIIHNFTVKCVVYGTLASFFVNRPKVVNSITGLGSAFIRENFLSSFIRFLYKLVFKISKSNVIFQNMDDLNYFLDFKIIGKDKSHLILGSGVDLTRFNNKVNGEKQNVQILFASRLLRDKGIVEFVEAVRLLNKTNSNFECIIAGDTDDGNPSSLNRQEFLGLIDGLPIKWLGHVNKIDTVIEDSDIVCLPSYREGTPMILLEAAAARKAIVATDVPGCRNVVVHGKTGLLSKVKDSVDLANQLERVLNDKILRLHLGSSARTYVEEHFERNKILSQILQIYCLE